MAIATRDKKKARQEEEEEEEREGEGSEVATKRSQPATGAKAKQAQASPRQGPTQSPTLPKAKQSVVNPQRIEPLDTYGHIYPPQFTVTY